MKKLLVLLSLLEVISAQAASTPTQKVEFYLIAVTNTCVLDTKGSILECMGNQPGDEVLKKKISFNFNHYGSQERLITLKTASGVPITFITTVSVTAGKEMGRQVVLSIDRLDRNPALKHTSNNFFMDSNHNPHLEVNGAPKQIVLNGKAALIQPSFAILGIRFR